MEPQAQMEIAAALKCRFEADALLGARAIPIVVPQMQPVIGQPSAIVAVATPCSPPRPARPPIDPAELEQRRIQLEVIDIEEVKPCVKCGLAQTRTKTVFGVGSPSARILFVGEAPGHDEDVSGEPFVGRAGKLLTDMIEKGMGLRREEVYICNVLKCRPPNNRTPAADEIAACKDYLLRQIEIIHPELIIALGAPAAQTLLSTREGIGHLRGRFHDFYPSGSSMIGEPIPLLPTFHPAYLLRSPGEKVKAWADLKLAMARLGIPLPKRG
jgi:uracil-DNA glycosylase